MNIGQKNPYEDFTCIRIQSQQCLISLVSHNEHSKFTCSGVNPAVGNFTESKMELAPPGSGAGAPGNAGKSSLDIWNSEEWSAGCFTIPTGEKLGYLTFPFFSEKVP